MEAIQRLPMISFELKSSPEATSFQNLKQCIAEYYGEDPESYGKEFRELEELRGLACRPRIENDCCGVLKRYYAQLHSLQNRFPLSSDTDLLTFAWRDIYSSSLWQTNNVKYEMASVLYNIAALHSKLGAEEERADSESMKLSCTHFQCAAWAFGEIKNQYGSFLKGDLSVEVLIFKEQICFAQAQECILEKSLADNRKAAIIAKVTAQIISFYNTASTMLFSQYEDGTIQDLIGSKLYKEWQKYIKFKTSYLSSVLLFYQGQHSEEQRKMGERVALLNSAFDTLEQSKKEAKGLNNAETINEVLLLIGDIIEGKRKTAKQENEFIYHEPIPDISSISAVQGANLVQGIAFDITDSQVIGEDIFKRLVPMKTHENLSLYSEEKANILRQLGAKIDERDNELASFMASLNMDSLNAMKQSQLKLPQNLVDRCAELSAKPNAISDLVDSMSNLANICTEVEMSLNEIKKILDEESKQEQNFQKQMGKRPTGYMTELTREFNKYNDAHTKAGESNDTLRKAMELHVSNLRILAQPLSSLRSQVPQSESIDEEIRHDLETLLNKVEEMKTQRDKLFEELRDHIFNKDDITGQLLAHGEKDIDELFKKELKKYSKSVNIIEQNLVAQGNILKALTDTYAKHAMTLKAFNDTKSKREQFYSGLIGSYDVYEDLIAKSAKGLDFYKKLHGNIQKLMSRVKAARDVQEEERQQLLKNAAMKVIPENKSPILNKTVNPNISSSNQPTGSSLKLKDYIKSGMVPGGLGGNSLREDMNKLPSVRPSPVGQEHIPITACSTINYPTSTTPSGMGMSGFGGGAQQPYLQYNNMYTNQQQYYQTDHRTSSHETALPIASSSFNNLKNEYCNNQQGYINPIYQQSHPYYQVASNNYANYYGQQYGTQANSLPQNIQQPSVNPAYQQDSYIQQNTHNVPQQPTPNSLIQQNISSSYSQTQQQPQQPASNIGHNIQTYQNTSQKPMDNFQSIDGHSNNGDFIQNIYKSQLQYPSIKSPTQQYPGYAMQNVSYQPYQLDQVSQQNYSCFTPATNTINSYMNAGLSDQPNVTESINYQESEASKLAFNYANASLQNQTTPIEASATVTNASHNAITQSTCSQKNQVSSPAEQNVKSDNMDLLSGIDFFIDNIPTLMPVSTIEKISSTLADVPAIDTPPIKMNTDLADLDFSNLNVSSVPQVVLDFKKEKGKIDDPFEDINVLKQFHKDVEGLEKYMETLAVKTLSGITPLANKWKELQDLLVKDEVNRSISVAKLFPEKNRFTEYLPYDHGRVLLPTSTDNYINAVIIKDCGQISFIMAQTPLDNTKNDWWEMIWSQKSNVLVCLHSNTELLDPFWPQTINEETAYGEISVVLLKEFEHSHCIENTFKVTRHGSDASVNISLLQIKVWEKRSADHVLDISQNIITTFKQLNPIDKLRAPIILSCISGGTERSGLVTLGISAILATQMKKPILLNVVDHWFRICSQRKGVLEDESYLQLSLQIVLNNAHRILNKHGIMTTYQVKISDKVNYLTETKTVKDSLQELDPFWKFK